MACETWARLSNCTVSGNRATTWGGGIYVKDEVHLTHCTVVGNYAKATCASLQRAERCPKDEGGGGIYVRGTLYFTNTIIARNGREDCARAPAGTYGMLESGKIGANSNNLVEDGSCEAAFSGDPLLEGLRALKAIRRPMPSFQAARRLTRSQRSAVPCRLTNAGCRGPSRRTVRKRRVTLGRLRCSCRHQPPRGPVGCGARPGRAPPMG